MAVQFNIDSHFNEDARYRKILFGYDGELLEVELNEMQDIMNARLAEVIDNVFGSRPLYAGTYSVSGGVLTIANEVVIANRELVLLTNSSIAVAANDTIYLNIQDVTKTSADPIKQYGDQGSNTTVTNYIQDSRVGAETTRRVQTTFQLVKNTSNPGTNIQLCTINSSGAVVTGNPDSFADSNFYKEIRRLADEEIAKLVVPATTSKAGIVQLVDSYTSTDATKAATANAANLAYTNAVNFAKAAGIGATALKSLTADMSITDANAVTTGGFYYADGRSASSPNVLNLPTQGEYILLNMDKQSAWGMQIAFPYTTTGASSTPYFRHNQNGTWTAWQQLATNAVATEAAPGLQSAADKTKLDGIQAGAEVNQFAFSSVAVGGTTLNSASKTDTLTIASSGAISVAGSGKTVTIGVAVASTTQAGVTTLVDSYTSTDATKAATANAVNLAYNAAVNWTKGYGLGTNSVSSSADLNTLTTNGFYYVTGMNRPMGAANGWLNVQATDASDVSQTFVNQADGSYWWRSSSGGTWGMWMQMAMGNQSVGSGDSPTFVNLTLTQALNINNNGNSTLNTTQNGVATAGSFFSGSAVNDYALRNELNGNILFGFKGASGTEQPALKIGYNGAANKATVATQRNTLDDGTGKATFASVAVTGALTTSKNTLDDGNGNATLTSLTVSGVASHGNNLQMKPTGTATSSTNYASNNFQLQNSTWNGSAAVTNTRSVWMDSTGALQVTNIGGGSNVASIDNSGNVQGNTFKSTAATGTAPFTVSSTSLVTNLNADTVDGYHLNQDVRNTASPTFAGVTSSTFTSNVATGTAPFTVASTTAVTNLNADMVDGYHLNQDVRTTASPTFAGLNAGTTNLSGTMTMTPSGTATSAGNKTSNVMTWQNSTWNGSAAVTNIRNMVMDSDNGVKLTNVGASAYVFTVDNSGNVQGNAFQSNVATGTAPFTVNSTTKVTNLNADMVDGYHMNQSVQTTDSPSFNRVTSTVATGTAPFVVSSTTAVTNLNADMVDGYHMNQSLQTTDSPTFSKLTSTVATGTAPFTVTSTTAVTNLNVDMVDGHHMNQDVLTSSSPSFAGLTVNGTTNLNGTTNFAATGYFMPTGVATSSTNYGSYALQFQSSTWNGSAAVTNGRNITMDNASTLQIANTSGTNVASIDNSGNIAGNTLKSTVATGTAPLIVASTTNVTNLSADMVDGHHMNQDVLTTSNPSFNALTLSVANGTAPMTVTSATKVTNLNADMVDGYNFNQSVQTTDSPSFNRVTSTVATGTAPFAVTSTTNVTNLSADMVDGYHMNQDVTTAGSPTFAKATASTLVSTVATGTAPFTVTSTTNVTNLSADMVDGHHMNQDVLTSSSPSFNALTLSVANGTAPMTVTSSTVVTNLNADMVDGRHADGSANGNTLALRDPGGNLVSNQFQSQVATGTAPFTVASTTAVTNLNADMVDGYHMNQSLQTTDSPTFAGGHYTGSVQLDGYLYPKSGGSAGITNNAMSQWGLKVTDSATPSTYTYKNTLDDGTGGASFAGSISEQGTALAFKYLRASNVRMEVHTPLFFTNGGSSSSTASVTFSTAYNQTPTIYPGNITANPVNYSDTILYPYMYNVTTTGFSAKLVTAGGQALGTTTATNMGFAFMSIGN